MISFLSQVAKEIVDSGRPLESLKIVLPSQRAVRLLKIELAKQLDRPALSPEVKSITDFASELSGLQQLPSHQLLLQCYKSYCHVVPEKDRDSFELYLNWAPVLLQDFNDLSAHRVPQDDIFTYLTEAETLKQWAQKEEQTPLVKNYLKFWKQIPNLFQHFTQQLLENKVGYLGLLFSESVENLSFYLMHTSQYHYLVGFNALTKSESFLFQEIISADRGNLRWDIDREFYENTEHAAGHFIRSYFREWKFLKGTKPLPIGDEFSEYKSLQCLASDHSISQVKHAARLAQQLVKTYPHEKIALVLGDETYLVPTLSGFDAEFNAWNVTMGYSLLQTPAADLILQWLDCLQQLSDNRVRVEALEKLGQTAYLKEYLAFLGMDFEGFVHSAKKRNQIYWKKDSILKGFQHPKWKELFSPYNDTQDLLNRMRKFCIALQNFFYTNFHNHNFESYFHSLEVVLNQLIETSNSSQVLNGIPLIKSFLTDLLKTETLDFEGDPTKGLQIMGLLETRMLDFDRVIVTHLNEGQLPAGNRISSFLPFEVKKEFGIPTFLEKEAIYAYHFYRLLQRSQDIYLLYNATQEGLAEGIPSRFIYQLEHFSLPKHHFVKKKLHANFIATPKKEREVAKSSELLDRLQKIAAAGFSPSALTHYLRDPMRFYEERVLGIEPILSSESMVSHKDQGTILHAVLESLFTPFQNRDLSEKDYDQMLEKLPKVLEAQFESIYGNCSSLQGKNHLIYQVLLAHCNRFLHYEKDLVAHGATIQILALEAPFTIDFPLSEFDFPIRLKGTVDRIDKVNEQVRIIDYKSGKAEVSALSLDPTALQFDDPKMAVAFQVLTYAFQYLKEQPSSTIEAGVYALKTKCKYLRLGWKKETHTLLSLEKLKSFEVFLRNLIREILTPEINFQEKKKGN